MPDNHDPVTLTLSALRTDVERTPLADSRSVRRRGDRRTRNQAVGGALAVVALVAGAAGIFGGTDGDRRATEIPATPTPTVTQESIATAPFLTPADLTRFGGYDQAGPFIDAGQAPVVDSQECRVRPDAWGADEVRSTRFYQDGSEVGLYEYVLRFDSVAAAGQAALKRAYSDLAACPEVDPADGEQRVRDPELVPGLEAQRLSRFFTPTVASETSYYEVAAIRRANIVVVLEWQAYGNPTGDGAADWVWGAERLQAALDRAVE